MTACDKKEKKQRLTRLAWATRDHVISGLTFFHPSKNFNASSLINRRPIQDNIHLSTVGLVSVDLRDPEHPSSTVLILAPIQHLQRRDGPLDHGRGGYWGMNNSRPTAYTALESLFLFQLLSKHGFINGSFDRIAQELQNTPLILEQSEYDAGRLTPGALQQLALQLLSEEQRREADAAAEKGTNGVSPSSKKRKLPNPPLPTLKEAHEHPEKLPVLVDRLYARFRDEIVRQIREDERLYQQQEREIDEIERGEWDKRINQERRADNAVMRHQYQYQYQCQHQHRRRHRFLSQRRYQHP
ncbi:hypothetical protein NUW58_g9493 [Xylaria curta]|uniref:Uncharacterized protein n=1 Tax=Xylaria curta TaxID=42375 RepID=A0ACC1MVX3_9PEZI|nr:hypothetical protein NUW58_g9493 [Xylaria curta]